MATTTPSETEQLDKKTEWILGKVPMLLKALGIGQAERKVLVDGILWAVSKVGEIDQRATRTERLLLLLAQKNGINAEEVNTQ
ncbi:MAG: hypothetical protein QOE90_929 [Thermoplasmata archaeon]|nr:hypothetical protein [Thermoplasmata archaeon]